MLFYLDILIKPEKMLQVKIKEKLVEWEGKWYSEEPPKYEYDDKLYFRQTVDISYYKKYYGKFISDDFAIDQYRSIRLLGSHLSELEQLINTNNPALEQNELCQFLMELSMLDDFVLFLIYDEEEIDASYRIKTKEELITRFCSCLNWKSPQGAVIEQI